MIPGIMAQQARMNSAASFIGVATVPTNGANVSPLQFNAAQIDTIGAYNGAQNTRLTLAQAGLVRHHASHFQSGANCHILSQRNGGDFNGMGYHFGQTGGVGFSGAMCFSAPVDCLAGDYFTTNKPTGGAAGDVGIAWQSIEVMSASLKGALVRRTSNQALNTASQVCNWEAEVYDQAGYFDPAFPTRLTVPADGLYRFTANLYMPATTWCYAYLRINGGDPMRGSAVHSSRGDFAQMTTAPLQLVAGDYVEVLAANDSSAALTAHALTWFAIEKVDPTIKRCLVRPTGQTIGTGNPAINFTEVYDPHNMFDATTNAQRIYVPAGCTQVRLSMSINCAWNGGKVEPLFRMNTGRSAGFIPTSSEHALCGLGGWAPTTPGEYASANFYASSNRANGTDNSNWYCMECR